MVTHVLYKVYYSNILANHSKTRRSPNVGSMLVHRLRRWPNIVPTLGESLMFAGMPRNDFVFRQYPPVNKL